MSNDPKSTNGPEPTSDAPDDAVAERRRRAALENEDEPSITIEELRCRVAGSLAEHLDVGRDLITQCERLAGVPKGDRSKPIFAAARMMLANARVAEALARLTPAEQRRRTIVEHIQSPAPLLKGSNSDFAENADATTAKMMRFMKLVADENFDPVFAEEERRERLREEREKADAAAAAKAATPPA